MLGWMLRSPRRLFLGVLILVLGAVLAFGAEGPEGESPRGVPGGVPAEVPHEVQDGVPGDVPAEVPREVQDGGPGGVPDEVPREVRFSAEIEKAAVSVLEDLGFSKETLSEVGAEDGGEVLKGFAALRRGERTKRFAVMAPAGADDLFRRIRRQLEYDMAIFLFEDDFQDRLDYVGGAIVHSGSMGIEAPKGACFLAGERGTLLVREARGSEAVFDRFWTEGLVTGLRLRRRGMLCSLWGCGGLRGGGIGFMMRIPRLYPIALVLGVSFESPSRILLEAGAAIELPLSSLFETSFPLVANARLLVDAKGGLAIDPGAGAGCCASMGVFYDHAVVPAFSWRVGWERRCVLSSGFSAADDFKAALVWNI